MRSLRIVLLCSLVITGSSFGTMPELSARSKNRLINSSIAGGMLGVAATLTVAGIVNSIDPEPVTKPELTFWCLTGAVAAAVGVLIGGTAEYYSLPEKHFAYAKEELSLISQDVVTGILYQSKSEDWLTVLKGHFCRSRFPLMTAFANLSMHYDKIVKIKPSISKAFTLDDQTVRQEAQELQEYANTTLSLLQAVLSKITSESNYANECAAKAQEDAANALKTVAATQAARLVNELNRPQYAYQASASQNGYWPAQQDADWQMTKNLLSTVQN